MSSCVETKILNSVCLTLVLLVPIVRLLKETNPSIPSDLLIFFFLLVAILVWMSQVKRRLVQQEERKYLLGIGALVIFILVVRTIKFILLDEAGVATRYAWYAYYIPIVLMPLLAFFAVLHIGMRQNERINRAWKLLYIPAALMETCVMTNDFHQLMFRFPDGFEAWEKTDVYSYGIVYFIVVAWVALLFMAVIYVAINKSRNSGYRVRLTRPLIPLIIGIIYTAFYVFADEVRLTELYKMPEAICICFVAFCESLILGHFFLSNDSYGDLWNASSLGGGIMDSEGRICYESEKCIEATLEQVQRAEKEAVPIGNGSSVLKSHRVRGGWSFWVRDIEALNKIIDELETLGDVLEQERAIIENENRLRSESFKVEQQTMIYTDIAKSVKPQLLKLKRMLENPPEKDEPFEKTMKYSAVLTAYVKRYANMVLSLHSSDCFYSDELERAIFESLEYTRLCGIAAHSVVNGEGLLYGRSVMLAYEVFESVLEAVLPNPDEEEKLSAVIVYITVSDGLTLKMELGFGGQIPEISLPEEEVAIQHGKVSIEKDDDTIFATLILKDAVSHKGERTAGE